MRATGRRIGRIVGQIDDLQVQVLHYLEDESADRLEDEYDRTLEAMFGSLWDYLDAARTTAEGIATRINRRNTVE